MQLSSRSVKQVATLARIRLGFSEAQRFRQELSSILEYVGQLGQVEVKKMQPLESIGKLKNITRKDQIDLEECLTQAEALSNAPETEKGFFRVKSVL